MVQAIQSRRLGHAMRAGGAHDFDQDIRGLDVLERKWTRLFQAQVVLVLGGEGGGKFEIGIRPGGDKINKILNGL